ncbi:ribonuclease P protein component [filamentous cyanobacterium LEGE 11480]|uniref:Ribonuclease P protein component n=1 Tax=Romeriopsis navalis LEGE 11480 TaxID=2777977 RepID=A0A928VI25_9CYAN|nr:ribonuclease P protein component [Romeriopsis navalis]MBE9028986.1 ribonuclease P protein component [Romeriopsis navalis LEGE 11480]
MALPQENRLKRRQDFDWVYQTGIRRRATHLHIVAVQTKSPCSGGLNESQFGISISKKVSKLAVVRNRLKRQIKAALRSLLPQIKPGWSVVIIVRSSILGCNYWQILRELEQLLLKSEVIRGD